MIHHPNAVLRYYNEDDQLELMYLWVMSIEQGYGMAGTSASAKYYSHWYPLNFNMGPLVVTGRVPYQVDYNNLSEYIRRHQRLMASEAGYTNIKGDTEHALNLLRFELKSEGVFVDGFIKSFNARQKRFDVAPEFTFEFEVIKDGFQDIAVKDSMISHAISDAWHLGLNVIPGEFDLDNLLDPSTISPDPPDPGDNN